MTSVPCPPRLTLKVDEAALTLKSTVAKVAVTDWAAFIVTEHVLVPLQAPLQPVNVEPAAGVAASVTVPLNDAEQLVPQLIPAGLLVTVPVPEPLKVTVRGYVVKAKVAVTDCGPLIVTEHVLVPVQPPLHPVNVDPTAGVAVSVTVPLNNAEQVVPQLIPGGVLVTFPEPDPLKVTVRG